MFPSTMSLAACRPWVGYESALKMFHALRSQFAWGADHWWEPAAPGWERVPGGVVVHALTCQGQAVHHRAYRKEGVIVIADGRAYRADNHQLVRWAREFAADEAAGFPYQYSGR